MYKFFRLPKNLDKNLEVVELGDADALFDLAWLYKNGPASVKNLLGDFVAIILN